MIFPRSARSILSCVAIASWRRSLPDSEGRFRRENPACRPSCFRPEKAPPSPSKPAAAESEIRATAVAFVQAFNRGDAQAVAALWTADGSAADDSGTIYKGRPAIEAQYAELFKQHPGAGWKWP